MRVQATTMAGSAWLRNELILQKSSSSYLQIYFQVCVLRENGVAPLNAPGRLAEQE